jgi:hypothetical protein
MMPDASCRMKYTMPLIMILIQLKKIDFYKKYQNAPLSIAIVTTHDLV